MNAPNDQPLAVTVVCSDPGDQPPSVAQRLGPAAAVETVFDTDQLRAALPRSDVVFVWDFRTTGLREAWANDSLVRWIHAASAGVEPLLFPEVLGHPVTLTNSRGIFDGSIAEFVLGAMLAAAKDLPASLRLQRQHEWRHRESGRLADATLLVIGAGSIGRATARLARAFGCHVIGVARSPRAADDDFDRGVVALTDLSAQLPFADYIAITAPLTAQTRGLLDADAFARMRTGTVLINVGRGPIVDEGALLAALDKGQLGFAVLDVFSEEPLATDHPFWDRPDVLVSPHMCGDFTGYRDVLVDLFVENFGRWRQGRKLRNVVAKERGY